MRRESVICLMVGFAWTYWNEWLFIIRCPSRPLTRHSPTHFIPPPLLPTTHCSSKPCQRLVSSTSSNLSPSQHLNHRYFFCAPFQLLRASIGPISSRVDCDCATRRPLRPPEHPNHNSSHNPSNPLFPPDNNCLCPFA
jgi:hypothetical protein